MVGDGTGLENRRAARPWGVRSPPLLPPFYAGETGKYVQEQQRRFGLKAAGTGALPRVRVPTPALL